MLHSLAIRDFAVVGRADLTLAGGLTVVTGETGAGKSILIDALSLIAGGRADSSAVRSGAERTEIVAEFDPAGLPAVGDWLAAQELDDDGPCLLRRVLRADGGSRAFINGRAASLQQLRELASLLVEIHGQHEHQALLSRTHQLELLDQYAQESALRNEVRTQAERWRALATGIDELRRNARDGNDLVDYLRHAVDELEQADPDPERVEALEAEHRRLAHSGELIEGLARLEETLGGDEAASLERLLSQAGHEIVRLQAYDEALSPATALLESAAAEVDEALSLVRRRREATDLDPERLGELERELARLHSLSRKHRVPIVELAALLAEMRGRLARAESAGERLQAMQAEQKSTADAYARAASTLGRARRAAALRLGEEVTRLMQELGMSGGHFECAFETTTGVPRPGGDDEIEFLVSANPGMPPRALRKVASGGELARISLAIKVATIALEDTPVLVFDEVDSGIGGAVAEIVGRKLRELGGRRQVLCVTHLAQVAACAHQHVRVSKRSEGGQTESAVEPLDRERRIDELARMQGGVEITGATRAAAADLLTRLSRTS